MAPAAKRTYRSEKPLETLGFGVGLRVGRDCYIFSKQDESTARFLDSLVSARSGNLETVGPKRSLMTLRSAFRKVIAVRPIAGLVNCFLTRASVEERRLAVWLLGRCGGKSEARLMFQRAAHCPPVLRREIVRSLRKLGAVRECASIAATDSDQRLKQIARAASRDLRWKVLTKWQRTLGSPADVAPPHPFELFVDVGPDAPHRPKSQSFIRRVLERIRLLVRVGM
jgi:hypothetical protein